MIQTVRVQKDMVQTDRVQKDTVSVRVYLWVCLSDLFLVFRRVVGNKMFTIRAIAERAGSWA